MTRRDLRRRLEQLEDGDHELNLETSISRTLVVSRKRAEREGREILGRRCRR
jgi:hypothetical protein